MDPAHLVRKRARLLHRDGLGRRLRRPGVSFAPAFAAGSSSITKRAPSVAVAVTPSRSPKATARRRLRRRRAASRRARKRSFGSICSNSIDTGAGTVCGKRLFLQQDRLESARGSLRRDDPAAARRGTDRGRAVRRLADAAVEPRRARRPLLPRLPQLALPLHRRQAGAGGADRARRDRRRDAVHPASGRIRARLDARAGAAARRPRRAARGEELARPARAADPLDGRLHRPGLGRPRHARALERREPPDHDLPRDEDRPALVRAAERAGREAVRLGRARLQVPGPEGADAEPLLEELRDSEDPRHRRDRLRRPGGRAAARRRRPHGAGARAQRRIERRPAQPGSRFRLDDRPGEPARGRRGSGRRRPPRRDPDRQARGVPERDGAGDARPARGRARGRRAAVRADVRARDDRGDEGSRPLLRREVADGAGREGVRARARDLPAELRLRAARAARSASSRRSRSWRR